MTVESLLKVWEHGISALVMFAIVVVGNLVAAWLNKVFFPMRLKKATWLWEKEKWATEQIFESLSRLVFIGKDFLESEFEEKLSFSGQSLAKTQAEIIEIVTALRKDAHRFRPYLHRINQNAFDEFLQKSTSALDEAKQTYGQWYSGDESAEMGHTVSMLYEQVMVAKQALAKIKFS